MVVEMSHSKATSRKQKYWSLRKLHNEKKQIFEDPEFPPTSLKQHQLPAPVVWKRPSELCPNPRLLEGRLNSSNVSQGSLGNCWFVAACCALAKEKDLWNKVVPHYEDQEYKHNSAEHTGIFFFRFWRFGEWVEVVIDDRLPTINGKLVFAHAKKPNEFWCSLMEKAYAKSEPSEGQKSQLLSRVLQWLRLHGSYLAIKGGNLVDALLDFTAGYAERLYIEDEGGKDDEEKRKKLFEHLKDEKYHHSLMCCAVTGEPNKIDCRQPNGLVSGHAYCITDVRSISVKRSGLFAFFKEHEHINMIRLRNPWGKVEWNGPFSDGSPEWETITSKDQNKFHLNLEEDGEFWMTFDDFCSNFTELSLCYLVNTSWFTFGHTWREGLFLGRWSNGPTDSATDRSGGCSNNTATFHRNPQFCFDVLNEGETLLIMLQQKDLRRQENNKLPFIGVTILKVELNRKYRLGQSSEMIKISNSKFIDTRNIFHKCELQKGRYVIIPSTFKRGICNDYLIRVFSKSDINLRELILRSPKQPKFSFQSRFRFVTRVTIREGIDIMMPDSEEPCNPYFVIHCEKKGVKGPVRKSTRNPKWAESVLFYRKHLYSKLKIQVWNKQHIRDVIMGQIYVEISKMDCLWTQQVQLQSVMSKKQSRGIGDLIVEIFNSKDLTSV